MKALAVSEENKFQFTVWAPLKEKMILHLVSPREEELEMIKDEEGYWHLSINDLPDHARYFFKPDGEKDFPDPASHYQPEGVHGPSQFIRHHTYQWEDTQWRGLPLRELILYELHVGTFTREGTFEAIIPFLDDLLDTGINALELMPVAQFPGSRNWGYDGVYPFAVQNSYGGPEGLKKLVDVCHSKGISVFLDVVNNHLGPEGNYLYQYAPYFTECFCTPWGDALNFDGEWCDGVREFFCRNAQHWFEHYHIDGLRLDAIHTVFDCSGFPFWELLHKRVKALEERLGRPLYLIAESDLNSPKVVKSPEVGGYGFNAQWLDDFHHALYVLVDKKGKERYADFGTMEQLAKAYSDGFVHSGEWVRFRKRRHGTSSAGVRGDKFIVFNLNHDQAGNRVGGERLCMLVDEERVKLAAAAIMLSPYIPMLFMGEEYADDTPFFYFVSHSDPQLIEAVRKGRKEEFKNFGFDAELPDAQDEKTFQRSKIHWEKRKTKKHNLILQWHKQLIELRRTNAVLRNFDKNDIRAHALGEQGLVLHRYTNAGREHLLILFNFSDSTLPFSFPATPNQWEKILDSKEPHWMTERSVTTLLPESTFSEQTIRLPQTSLTVYSATEG